MTGRPMYIVGDVHGDGDRLVSLLTSHGIISIEDGTVRWVARDVILLFMGDILDASSRRGEFGNMVFQGSVSDMWILELLRVLESEAEAMGNTLLCILGNHEVMNMLGQFDYVSPHHLRNPASRRQYFGPGGVGREIIQSLFQTSVKYNGNLYSHAGIPLNAPEPVRKIIGVRVRGRFMDILDSEEVTYFTSHREYMVPATPELNHEIAKLCRRNGVERMVIGHNCMSDTHVARFEGRVVFADIGLSRAFNIDATRGTLEILFDPGDGKLVILGPGGSRRPVPVTDQ